MSDLSGCNGGKNGACVLADPLMHSTSRVSHAIASSPNHVARHKPDNLASVSHDMNSRDMETGAMATWRHISTMPTLRPVDRGAGSQIVLSERGALGRAFLTRGQKISTKSFFMSHDMNRVAA